jgi:EAL domain-containing protein (putative c-di-GMP-specific phosphodiesterase class I)/CheY-like chemotaxis protein
VSALKKLNFNKVCHAADGYEALYVLSRHGHMDITICDLKMAGMDGLEFLRRANSDKKIGAVALCSSLDFTIRQASISLIQQLGIKFLGELKKPFNVDSFQLMLNKHLHASKTLVDQPYPHKDFSFQDINNGLNNGEFEAFYQPKVTLRGRKLAGGEVLARWNHPELGVLLPHHFLPVMENTSLIDKLFWQIFEKGLEFITKNKTLEWGLKLAFNISPWQLDQKDFGERIALILHSFQLSASHLTFEVTESTFISSPISTLENLIRLRMMGCGLSIDDFGTGYSSLDRLSELPVTEIKLDRKFVRQMNCQPKNSAIISCAIALAESLDIPLVIEGVETTEQEAYLIDLGCTFAQGFLYAKPMPEKHFLQYCLR